ncbi:MAG: hypothetical protein KKG59_06175 [Nanoarchaeota archaeon]|nr:hypothetical protein [Nanoarchaeota archaeon]
MKKKLLILMTIMLLVFAACKSSEMPIEPEPVVPVDECSQPKKMIGSDCCLDEDDNGMCDLDENYDDTGDDTGDDNSGDETDFGGDPNAEVSSTLEEVDGVDFYLDVFKFRDTKIVFDIERSRAPLVTAAMDILGAFSFADNIKSEAVMTKNKELADYTDEYSLILLGNACNNDLIAELYGLDKSNCLNGLEEGKGIIKLGKYDRKYILVIMGAQEEDVAGVVTKLVNDDITYSSDEKTVIV